MILNIVHFAVHYDIVIYLFYLYGRYACSAVCNSLQPSTVDLQAPLSTDSRTEFQARILEKVAISSFRGSSGPRDQTLIFCNSCIGRHILFQLGHLGSPITFSSLYLLTPNPNLFLPHLLSPLVIINLLSLSVNLLVFHK